MLYMYITTVLTNWIILSIELVKAMESISILTILREEGMTDRERGERE